MPSVIQPWAQELSFRQQAVLIAAVRGPDGLHKEHPAKHVLRWLRRCFLVSSELSAPGGVPTIFRTPHEPGGGSFLGPIPRGASIFEVFDSYLDHVDEVPHHFHNHLMHAVEILGYKHEVAAIRAEWLAFYEFLVGDAHLLPESEAAMDARLGDH